MPFHRLTAPAYYLDASYPGSLFGESYDGINDPATTGGSGVASSADGVKVGGPNDGVYFMAFGEDAASAYFNRANKALAENTDYIDDILHQDIATLTSSQVSSGHGGSSSIALNGSTDNIYVSASGATPITDLFTVTTLTDEPIFVSGTRVVASSLVGAAIGDGFTAANPLTVNFNLTIPDAQSFRVHYGIRDNHVTLPTDALMKLTINRALRVTQASSLQVDDANFTAVALTDIVTKSGGVGTPITTVQEALDNVDSRLTKLRAFTAVVSDGTSSFGGDVETAVADDFMSSATLEGGWYLVKEGVYTFGDSTTFTSSSVSLMGAKDTSGGTILLALGASHASGNLAIGSQTRIVDVGLSSSAVADRFLVGSEFIYESNNGSTVSAGSLLFSNGGTAQSVFVRGLRMTPNSTHTTNNGVELTDAGRYKFEGCRFDEIPSSAVSPVAAFYMHDFFDNNSYAHFENCVFESDTAGASALYLNNVVKPTKFTNCEFRAVVGSTTGWAANLENCDNILFENCLFEGREGQVLRAISAGATFKNCKFISGTGVALTDPQFIVGYGRTAINDPLVFENCDAIFYANNVNGTTAPTTSIFEFGGEAGTAGAGRVIIDGFTVTPHSGVTTTHNFSTVLLRGSTATAQPPNSFRNFTYNAGGKASDNNGTLGSVSGVSNGALVEVTPGAKVTEIENLKVLDVSDPASSHARGLVYVDGAIVRGLTLDGTSVGGGAGHYQSAAVIVDDSDVHDLDICPVTGIDLGSVLSISPGARVLSGRYHRRGVGVTAATSLFSLSAWAELKNFTAVIDVNISSGAVIVATAGTGCTVEQSKFFIAGTTTTYMIDALTGDNLVLRNSDFYWQNTSAIIANFDVGVAMPQPMVHGCRFMTSATGPNLPTVTGYTGADRFPATITDDNQFVDDTSVNIVPTW